MKTSVSIPDDLWAEATGGRSISPSELVQDALRALVEREAGGQERLIDFRERLEGALVHDDHVYAEGIERLLEHARELRDTGYRLGLNLANKISWLALEALPGHRRLVSELMSWAEGVEDAVPGVSTHLYQLLKDWEFGLDQDDEPVKSPVLYTAVAEALLDVRATVLAQLRAEEEAI